MLRHKNHTSPLHTGTPRLSCKLKLLAIANSVGYSKPKNPKTINHPPPHHVSISLKHRTYTVTQSCTHGPTPTPTHPTHLIYISPLQSETPRPLWQLTLLALVIIQLSGLHDRRLHQKGSVQPQREHDFAILDESQANVARQAKALHATRARKSRLWQQSIAPQANVSCQRRPCGPRHQVRCRRVHLTRTFLLSF